MLKDILKQIKPSKKEERDLKKQIKEVLSKIKIKDAKVIVGGSFAKNTWLKGDYDVDIFVKFNYKKYKSKSGRLADILEKNIRSLKPERLHGSRDYFRFKKNDLIFEVVPILDIKKAKDAVNITDVSPLHAIWVKKHKKEDEIRLTKAFAKSHKIYGAESHIQGFSGYVLEILTIHYGSFLRLVRNVSKWKKKTIIDTEKLLKNPLIELNNSKLTSPLILIDPVDKNRNAAAAVSQEKYNLFIKTCKDYLKKPNNRFFIVHKEKIPRGALAIEFKAKGKKDSVGGKFFSLFNKLKKQFVLEGYRIKKSGFIYDDNIKLWFLFREDKLSEYIELKGPSIKDKKNVERFKKKHKRVYVRKNKLYSKEKRKFRNARDFLMDLLKKYKLSPRYL